MMLNVPCISLDELYWKPGWTESTQDEMRAKITQALDAAPNGWVVDGNYKSKGGSIAWERATDIICTLPSTSTLQPQPVVMQGWTLLCCYTFPVCYGEVRAVFLVFYRHVAPDAKRHGHTSSCRVIAFCCGVFAIIGTVAVGTPRFLKCLG